MTRRLQETESAPRCEFTEAGSGELGVVVFIGNLVLVVGFLVALFVVHVTFASGAEAYWLEKVTPHKHVLLLVVVVFIVSFFYNDRLHKRFRKQVEG